MMRKKTTSWYSRSSLVYWVLITFLAGLCLMTHSPFSSNNKIKYFILFSLQKNILVHFRWFYTVYNYLRSKNVVNQFIWPDYIRLLYLWKPQGQYPPTPTCGYPPLWEQLQSHWHCKSGSCTQGEDLGSVTTTNTTIYSILHDSKVKRDHEWDYCLWFGHCGFYLNTKKKTVVNIQGWSQDFRNREVFSPNFQGVTPSLLDIWRTTNKRSVYSF